ncbi:hypothetical protein ACHHYP_11517 [Achlya hypogyna]|uniref:Uncharacterized protein n=1 Tax=Achlya hypogyna TaxID=1202772 RepID=A0A1V9YJ11_ACHHY|nr:hypothetical protein ACHHYP_11517 [Achlya hypogyna]
MGCSGKPHRCRPCGDDGGAGRKLAASFGKITSNTWIKALRKAQPFEDTYVAIADEEVLAEDDTIEDDQEESEVEGLLGDEEH